MREDVCTKGISFANVNFIYKRKTCALFLDLFLHKIIYMPKRHMLGCPMLVPFRVKAGRLEQEGFLGERVAGAEMP